MMSACMAWVLCLGPMAGADTEGPAQRPAVVEGKPMLLAYYYTWYTTGFGKHKAWSMWMRESPSTLYPEGTDANVLRFPPAIRNIASCAYPLVGPYDSDNRAVVRWHIRLARAAGIDGFLVDVWGKLLPECERAFFDAVLPVAEEEDFKVALYDEAPQFGKDHEENAAWAAEFLNRCKESPAYIRINGEPLYGVYQVWEGRMTPDEGRAYFDAVERAVGPVYWLVDRIVARPGGGRPDNIDGFRVRPGWEDVGAIDAFGCYATFSNVREYHPTVLSQWYGDLVREVHGLGRQVALPVHPGLDSRAIQTDGVAAAEEEPHWTIPRAGGRTLRAYLDVAAQSGADIITVTSFNEWPETTVVEPALTWPDPYRYLKVIADFTGTPWETPPLPPLEALDPAIRDHLRTGTSAP